MINREQIESILKVNGVEPSSPNEVIRSVLLSARYSTDEVDTAIMVLRENTKTNKTRVDGLHKVFRTNEALSPSEISQLLGIEVDIDQTPRERQRSRKPSVSGFQFVIVWVVSVLLAVAGVFTYMYVTEVGIFHPSVGLTQSK